MSFSRSRRLLRVRRPPFAVRRWSVLRCRSPHGLPKLWVPTPTSCWRSCAVTRSWPRPTSHTRSPRGRGSSVVPSFSGATATSCSAASPHVSGVLSVEHACALVAARGRLMGARPAGGAMAAIEATEQEVLEALEDGVEIAGVNGPRAIVVSGDQDAVERLRRWWSERGRRTTRLRVSHAFHSRRMEPMLAQFAEVARNLSFRTPEIPIVSNVSGDLLTAEEAASPDYWVRHARQAVRF